jgi:pyrroloquinoline quinone biosynthesis protein E
VTTPRPYTLVAELTHRCALRCAYCANPVELMAHGNELDTPTWARVLTEAEAVGVVQVHLTGGEPLLRRDLEAIVARAREVGLYTNLITSGIPASPDRLAALRAAGLDAVQLSLQDVDATHAARIAGADVAARKLDVARWVKELGLPLTLNVVLHRGNIDRVDEVIALAVTYGADRLELANTQYLGWALLNRAALLPTAAQIDRAHDAAARARRRLGSALEIVFVLPDYHRGRPKACMDGWARRFIVMTPAGGIQPCHLAGTLLGLAVPNVRDTSVGEAWAHAALFEAFRGEEWMPEPCRSCPERHRDFGGCRCQAFALTGDAAATDPACALAPHHAVIAMAHDAARTRSDALVHRDVRR